MNLGDVGTGSPASVASKGHLAWSVGINRDKRRIISEDESPIVKKHLADEAAQAQRAPGDIEAALQQMEICLGAGATPRCPNGRRKRSHLLCSCEQIAHALVEPGLSASALLLGIVLPSAPTRAEQDCSTVSTGGIKLFV